METLIYKVKSHCAAIILAILLGVLIIIPFFYFKTQLGPTFQGIWPSVVDDESFYLSRIKDVIDGHPFLSNAYLAEHKEGLPQQLFLAENILAWPLELLGVDVNSGHLIYNFLMPAIAFILSYVILYLIVGSRLWSAIGSSFLFFGLFLLSFIRPVSPQFNFIFWLTQLIFLWLLVNNPNIKTNPNSEYSDKIRIFGLLGANIINFGLLFYIYPYYWTFYLILFGLLAISYFWKERTLSYKILMIVVGGLILAVPYFYFNYLATKLPYYMETLTRLQMIYTRFPSGLRIMAWSFPVLALILVSSWRKIISTDVKTIFFAAGVLSSIIAVNQHIITGRNFEFSSHYSMGAIFFAVFALAYLFSHLNPNKSDYHPNTPNDKKFGLFGYIRIFGLLIIAIVVIFSLSGYLKRILFIGENHVYYQNYAPVFDWLNKNTEKDSVVYANAELSRLIPVYTANNVYYVREANLFFISDEEVLDRFILNKFFEKFDKDFVTENVRSVYGVRYIDIYGHAVQGNKLRRLLGLKLEPEIYLPKEAIAKAIARAGELQKGDFLEELKRFRIDYLVWDKIKNPNWEIEQRYFKKVFETDYFKIFDVR